MPKKLFPLLPLLPAALWPWVLWAPFVFGQQVLYWGTPLLQFYPWRWLAWEQLQQGHWPLWNPLVGNGAPLLANYQSALLYPLTWLGWLGPLDLTQSWSVVFHLSWAGVGMGLLARRLGFQPLGQAIAGLTFGLSQYLVARVGFFSINATVAWLPWVVWAVERLLFPALLTGRARVRSVLVLTACLAMLLLAGHAQTAWYTCLLAGVWVVGRSLMVAEGRWPRLVWGGGLLAVAGLWAALIAAAQLWPTAELLQASPRATAAEYEFVMTYSFSPWRLLTAFAPDLLGNPARGHFYGYGNYWEDAIYSGLLPMLFLLGALARLARPSQWRAAETVVPRLALLVMGAALLIGLGRNTPIFPFLYEHVPTFNLFQAPTRWMVWWVFGLALVAGWGADHWQAPQGRSLYWTRLGAAGAVAMTLMGLGGWWLTRAAETELSAQLNTVAIAFALLGIGLFIAALLSLLKSLASQPLAPNPQTRLWPLAVLLFLLADLGYHTAGLNPGAPPDLYRRPPVTSAALQTALQGHRLLWLPAEEYDVKFGDYLSFFSFGPPALAAQTRAAQLPNVALLDGLASANNFDPLVSARYAGLLDVISETHAVPLLAAMDVGVVASHTPLAWDVVAQVDSTTFYRVPLPPQRLWAVTAAQTVSNAAAAQIALADPAFDPFAQVILEADDPAHTAPLPAAPPPTRRGPQLITATLTLAQPGWAVLADTHYPGWRAWVDGQPAPILHANYAFRAVPVPAGTHEIVFAYQPTSFAWGGWLSLGALGVWGAGLGWAMRKKQ